MAQARLINLGALLSVLFPILASAQTQPVGVITTLTGQATVARTTLRDPLILKFKDDVFERDRISTAEKSIVRVLLGGKALVTVRELSVLTITEETGRATIDLSSGKIAVAVAKARMRPGESLEVRTPNVVAAVRGTVFVVETRQAGTSQASGAGSATSFVTNIDVDSGPVEVTAPSQPTPITVLDKKGIDIVGTTPTLIRDIRADAFDGFRTQPMTAGPSSAPANEKAISRGQDQAALLALVVSPPPPLPNTGTSSGTVLQAPIISTTNTKLQDLLQPNGVPPAGGGNSGGNGAGLLQNGGFESGFQGWTLTGAGGVITALGSIKPPAGQFDDMGLLHTSVGAIQGGGLGPSLNPPLPPFTDSSKLTQSFAVTANSLYVIKATYNFLSNEFPTQATVFDDRFEGSIKDPAGNSTLLALERRNISFSPSTVSPETATAGGFTIFQGNGVTGFKSFTQSWVPTTSGQATLVFDVGDVGDMAVQSAVLLYGISVVQDPPRYFVGSGDTLTSTQRGAYAEFANQRQTFDSLMVVCCQGRATLAGPLLRSTSSDLTVPFSLLSVLQGGSLITSSTEPLALLQGGTHTFGSSGLAMFDLSGLQTAVDTQTGLSLGTDQPLQHGGPLLETDGATVQATKVVQLDTALFEATAPLLSLRGGSTVTTAADTVDLSYRTKVISLGPVVRLDASTLTVISGAALHVGGGSVLRVTGDLFSLSNGSTLRLLNGPLLSLSGNSLLTVTGALVAFGGAGGNAVSVTNSLCPCTTIAGIPVSLTGGALPGNISITGAAVKNPALGAITLSSPNAAVIRVDGAGTKLTIKGL